MSGRNEHASKPFPAGEKPDARGQKNPTSTTVKKVKLNGGRGSMKAQGELKEL